MSKCWTPWGLTAAPKPPAVKFGTYAAKIKMSRQGPRPIKPHRPRKNPGNAPGVSAVLITGKH